MGPKDCPYAVKIGPQSEKGIYGVQCAKISAELGWNHSIQNPFCEKCIGGGWHEQPTLDVPPMRAMVKRVLAARFRGGDCPKWAYSKDLDISDCFGRYVALSTKDEQRETFKAAIVQWAATSEEEGGHPMEVVVEKAEALAAEFGLEDVLAELTTETDLEA